MKSRSILKKVATLAIVLALVMSVAGMAMAHHNPPQPSAPKTTVSFNWNGGNSSLTSKECEVKGVQGKNDNEGYIEFYLPTSADGSRGGYELTGWDRVNGQGDYNPGQKATITVRKYNGQWQTVSMKAKWITLVENYTLHYEITPIVEGQPANPGDETGSAFITPTAEVEMEGYNFSGWTVSDYELVDTEYIYEGKGQNRHKVGVRKDYEATATGFFTLMEVVEVTAYNLFYTGTYIDGALFWPADVTGVDAPPELAGNPYLAGYYFSGWQPGTLDWSNATEVVTFETVEPEGGTPYILRTVSYTITAQGTFTAEPTEPEEIPLGAPQTGAFDWSGIAGALAVLSSLGVAFVARKKEK